MLLDTCALLWWTLQPEKLSPKALLACKKIEKSGGLVSSMSLWEIGLKINNGRLDLGFPLRDYVDRLKKMNLLTLIPVDENLWMANLELKWKHRDPVDRTLVATAMLHHTSLITSDKEIRQFYKKTIW